MGDSPVWTDLLKVKQIYLRGRQIITKNGKHTLLWKDKWLHDQPLCVAAPVVFESCEEKKCNSSPVLDEKWTATIQQMAASYLL
jgi:hypothetical protein